ncbi:MAG: shikimate dehydrogenase [Firmicutes bacterium]|nr:shikimate dehydrogenase [Bacillota bacterium]
MKHFGLLGEHLGHSLSPQLHKIIMFERHIEGDYTLVELPRETVEQDFLKIKSERRYTGLNVTIPYKQTVMPLLDEIAPQAQMIGAVNTIHFTEDGRTVGYNTDYYGVLELLNENKIDVQGKKVLILGAGGAARAFIAAIRAGGATEIHVASRSAKVGDTYMECPMVSYDALEQEFHVDLVVNCTPVGMWPNEGVSPISAEVMKRLGAFAALDAIYNPDETQFLKYAKELGMIAANGMTMLMEQAVKAQEIWNSK